MKSLQTTRMARACSTNSSNGGNVGSRNILIWFRRDLRLHDNEAIYEAALRAVEANRNGNGSSAVNVDFCFVNRQAKSKRLDRGAQGVRDFGTPFHLSGGASLAWLGSSLKALDRSLTQTWGEGAKLIYRECEDDHECVFRALAEIAGACGSECIYFGRCYEPFLVEEERYITNQLLKAKQHGSNKGARTHGIREVRSFSSYLLHEPSDIAVDMRRWKGHFGTLMPFLVSCQEKERENNRRQGGPHKSSRVIFPIPAEMPVRERRTFSECERGKEEEQDEEGEEGDIASNTSIAALRCWTLENPSNSFRSFLEPEKQADEGPSSSRKWIYKIVENWCKSRCKTGMGGYSSRYFGEADALLLLDEFMQDKMRKYENSRGYADGRAVSKLSPHLHWGSLSVKLMVSKLEKAGCQKISKTFWRRMVWRDLAYWQLHHWPNMASHPIRKFYSEQKWVPSDSKEGIEAIERWKRGTTGYPLVDAGMRELWETGWMQQNARMACALFLTEYCSIHWVEGAKWFHECLFDADQAINSMMWQNAGKGGLDQWNFTVSPTAKSLDPTGDYIKRFVPELAKLPKRFLHSPWEAPDSVLTEAGVCLGETYPHRISLVRDTASARSRNLEAIREMRRIAKEGGFVDTQGYDIIKTPRGSCRGGNNGKIRVFTKPEYRSAFVKSKREGSNASSMHEGGHQKKKSYNSRKSAPWSGRNSSSKERGPRKKVFRQLSLEDCTKYSEYFNNK